MPQCFFKIKSKLYKLGIIIKQNVISFSKADSVLDALLSQK